ncbi:MAG: response regulator [Patescibacteria group bacterium]
MKKSILIIEDEEFFRELLAKKISSKNFSVFAAVNGQQGLKEIKEKKPDLILLDLLLPDIDGFEVLSKIKSDSETSSIPVIILSNLGEQEDFEKGMKLGAVDYLVKSQSDMVDIIDKIKNILEKK